MEKKTLIGRRGFLKGAGAVTVVVAGGTVWRAFDQGVFSTGQGIEPKFGNVLKGLIGEPTWQALMPFRMGYPLQDSLPSPRRSVEDVIV